MNRESDERNKWNWWKRNIFFSPPQYHNSTNSCYKNIFQPLGNVMSSLYPQADVTNLSRHTTSFYFTVFYYLRNQFGWCWSLLMACTTKSFSFVCITMRVKQRKIVLKKKIDSSIKKNGIKQVVEKESQRCSAELEAVKKPFHCSAGGSKAIVKYSTCNFCHT